MQQNKKPNTLFCYLCGREFGSNSLEIHLKSCQKKFSNQQQNKQDPSKKIQSTKITIKVPKPPQQLEKILQGQMNPKLVQIYNEKAIKIHKYQVLPACRYCGRTFNQASLASHQNGCKSNQNLYSKTKVYQKPPDEFKKPKTLTCCICGRDFGVTSLKIHYPQCIDKFNSEQAKKPKKDRRQPPLFTEQQIQLINTKQQWTLQETQQFNKLSLQDYRNKGLMQCENCGRKFFPESLIKHKKTCILIRGQINSKSSKNISKNSVDSSFRKPRVLLCHICGREFGLTSLTIHQKQCAQKFMNQQNKKPVKQRKPLPQYIPDQNFNLDEAPNWTNDQIQQYNKQANSIYRNEAMDQCPICSRKFIKQSLPKHLKYCQVYNTEKFPEKAKQYNRVKRSNSAMSINSDFMKKPKVITCYICGRQFGLSSITIHQRQCIEKFQKLQLKKLPSDRRKLPEFPQTEESFDLQKTEQWSVDKINLYNQLATQIYRDQSLFQCPTCGRKFFEQSLPKHMKNCSKNQKNQSASSFKAQVSSQLSQKISKPKVLMCHICGRQFGLTSLLIHQKKCKQKFINQQSKRPQNQRRILPALPSSMTYNIEQADKWSIQMIQNYNKIANQVYRTDSLHSCPICYRKFFEDSLSKHLKFCQKNKQKQDAKTQLQQAKARKTFSNNLHINKSASTKMSKKSKKDEKNIIQEIDENRYKSQKSENSDDDKEEENKLCEKYTENGGVQTISEKSEKFQSTGNQNFFLVEENQTSTKKQESQIQYQMLQKIQNKAINEVSSSLQVSPQQKIKIQQHQDLKQLEIVQPFQDIIQDSSSISKPQQKQIINLKTVQINDQQSHQMHQKRGQTQIKNIQKLQQQSFPQTQRQNKAENKQLSKMNASSSPKKLPPLGSPDKVKTNLPQSELASNNYLNIPQKQMQKCIGCNRNFYIDRIAKHQQFCKQAKQKLQMQSRQRQKQKRLINHKQIFQKHQDDQIQSLKLVPCFKCGRKFAQARIDKHVQACKKDVNNEKNVLKKEKELKIQTKIQTNQVQKNQLQLSANKQVRMAKCQKCGRTFNYERIEKHTEVCKGTNKSAVDMKNETKMSFRNTTNIKKQSKVPLQQKSKYNIPTECQEVKSQLKPCKNCGRKFNSDRVEKHQQICKGSSSKKHQPENTQNKKTIANTGIKNPTSYQRKLNQLSKQELEIPKQKLQPCFKCARKFASDRLEKHTAICKAPQKQPYPVQNTKIIQKQQLPAEVQSQHVDTLLQQCQKCSRKFVPQRIAKHQEFCKGPVNNKQVLRKTKNNFMNMVKNMKQMKKQEDEIDRQIEQQLQSLKNTKNAKGTKLDRSLCLPKI